MIRINHLFLRTFVIFRIKITLRLFILSFILPSVFYTSLSGQNKPLLDDHETAKAIQAEMEKWGDEVTTADAWQMAGMMGLTSDEPGTLNSNPESLDLFHSKITYNKNTAISGLSITNKYLSQSLGNTQMANALFDTSVGIALKEMPYYKFGDLGTEGVIETQLKCGTYDGYPSKLGTFFTAVNYASFCHHLYNTLSDLSSNGVQKASAGSYIKVATGGLSLAAGTKLATGLLGGPATVFIGAALWICDQYVDIAQNTYRKVEEDLAYGDFVYYHRYNNNADINWVEKLKSGTWSEVLKKLHEYWDADFSGYPDGERMDERRNFVKSQYENYKAHLAFKFVNEFIVPDLMHFFQLEAEQAKEEAVQSLRDYIASLYDAKAVINMKLAYQGKGAQNIDVQMPIKLTITNLLGTEVLDESVYDVKMNGQHVEIEIKKIEYIKWLTKNSGTLYFKIESETAGEKTDHLMSPNWIDPFLGEDGDGYPVRTQIRGDDTYIHVDVPIEVNIETYEVIIQVVGVSGDKLSGIRIQGPDGRRYDTNNQGEATLVVPTLGKSWVYEVDAYGGLDGARAEIPNKPRLATSPPRITIKSLLYEPTPPWPSFERLDIRELQTQVESTLAQLSAGTIDCRSASSVLNKAATTIDTKLRHLYDCFNNSSNLYRKRAAVDKMPPGKVQSTLDAKRQLYDNDRNQALKLKKEWSEKFSQAEKNWKEKFENGVAQLKPQIEQINALCNLIKEDAKVIDYNNLLVRNYVTPHTSGEFSLLGSKIQEVNKLQLQTNKLADRIKSNGVLMENAKSQLESSLSELMKMGEVMNFSQKDYRYIQAVTSLINADISLTAINTLTEYDGIEDLTKEMGKAQIVLSGIQQQSLGQIELAKKYDQLVQKPPKELANSSPLFTSLEELKTNLGKLNSSVDWALRVESMNRKLHFARYDTIRRHNGYGVDAWPMYNEIKTSWKQIDNGLEKAAIIADEYKAEVDTMQKQINSQLQQMQSGGWIVEDVKSTLITSANQHVPLRNSGQLRQEHARIKESIEKLDKEFDRSVVTVISKFDVAWSDAQKYKSILKRAVAAAKSGDLNAAELIIKEGNSLVPNQATQNTSRGNINYRELFLDKEGYELEQEYNNLIYQLKRDAYNASLAHLSFTINGGTLNDLRIDIFDKDNIKQSTWDGKAFTLEPGQYRVQCTSEGKRVEPTEQVVNLAKGEKRTLAVTISNPIVNNKNNTSTTTTGNFNFDRIKTRIFAYDISSDMNAPAWSEDSKIVVAGGTADGLTAFDLENNSSWQVTTKTPLPPPGLNDATINSIRPKVIGNSVVHKMNMEYQRSPSRNSTEFYWMVVPLEGGQGSALLRERSYYFKILDTRQREGSLEYLLAGDINNRIGVYLLAADSPDYTSASFLHPLNNWYDRFFVSPDWKLICIGDANYQNGYEIYELGGSKIASLPQSFLHTFTFSPDGKYIAGHQRLNQAPWNQLIVFPINDIQNVSVVESGAVRYDEVAWSPNGRYLVYQRRRQNPDHSKGEVEFVVADIVGTGPSLADGGEIVKTTNQTNNTQNNQNNTSKKTDTQAAYQEYIEAYNKLTSLMAAGKGNTPEARAAYAEYEKKKREYEESLNQE